VHGLIERSLSRKRENSLAAPPILAEVERKEFVVADCYSAGSAPLLGSRGHATGRRCFS